MNEHKLGIMEMRFAQLIWDNEPVSSGELVKLCESEFQWKKSTTYTMLRRLCQRDIFQNENGLVTSLMSRQEFDALQSEQFVESNFSGSLPRFLAAFTMRNKLSEKDISELLQLIEESRRRDL